MSGRNQRSRTFRAICVVALLFAMVLQPALMIASEVHEASHALIAGHAHDAVHDEAGIPDDEPETGFGFLHSALHLGHCCSAPTAAVYATPALRASRAEPTTFAESRPNVLPAETSEPLRPPIFA